MKVSKQISVRKSIERVGNPTIRSTDARAHSKRLVVSAAAALAHRPTKINQLLAGAVDVRLCGGALRRSFAFRSARDPQRGPRRRLRPPGAYPPRAPNGECRGPSPARKQSTFGRRARIPRLCPDTFGASVA